MTKGERLIWDLFLMVKELMPATADNTRRQQEWAAKFHAMEHPELPPPPPPSPDTAQGSEGSETAEPESALVDDEPTPAAPAAGKRKRR